MTDSAGENLDANSVKYENDNQDEPDHLSEIDLGFFFQFQSGYAENIS